MNEQKQITHTGIIKAKDGNSLNVSIMQQSACAKCTVKGVCEMAEKEEKIVNIQTPTPNDFKIGEMVTVFYKQTLGFRALLLGYLLPFLIVLTALIILMAITNNEAISALTALGLLIPYHITLHLTKNKLKKTFSFSVEKN